MQITHIIAHLDAEIARLQEVRSVLSGTTSTTAKRMPGKPRLVITSIAPKKRIISAEARARIAAAQKARWAKVRKAAKAA